MPDYTAEKVRTLCASPDELRARRADAVARASSPASSSSVPAQETNGMTMRTPPPGGETLPELAGGDACAT